MSVSTSVFIHRSLAYLQCCRVRGVGLNDVNIVPAYFSGNLGVDGCLVADEAEDGIGWVFRELADELELDNRIFPLVMSLGMKRDESVRHFRGRLQ